jgi:hypothetical protein
MTLSAKGIEIKDELSTTCWQPQKKSKMSDCENSPV